MKDKFDRSRGIETRIAEDSGKIKSTEGSRLTK